MSNRRWASVLLCTAMVIAGCGSDGGGGGSSGGGGGGGGGAAATTTERTTIRTTIRTEDPSTTVETDPATTRRTTQRPTTTESEESPTTVSRLTQIIAEIKQQDQIESEADTGQPAVFTSANAPERPTAAATTEYLNAVIKNADEMWTAWFESVGLVEPWVGITLIQPGATATSKCSIAGQTTFNDAFPNAFYCPLDANTTNLGVLVIPVTTMSKMWTGNIFNRQVSNLQRTGDFAAASLMAHEFGHHIQDELSTQLDWPKPTSPGLELIADCFAGVWAYTVFIGSYLEDGDLTEAIDALSVIGDSKGSHGTGEERDVAFKIGYYGSQADPRPGVPLNCIKAFWKNAPLG